MKDRTKLLRKILNELRLRDKKDLAIDRKNRRELIKEGLKLRRPKRIIKIDTGKIIGVENVVNLIISKLDKKSRIISVEGLSGAGKSSTAELLQKKLKAFRFSMGEIFRYLTYTTNYKFTNTQIREQTSKILKNLSYQVKANQLCLFDHKKNITKNLAQKLREPLIESKVPEIAALSQKLVIQFVAEQLEKFKKRSKRKILIEGRAFTIDFLPSDLRIKLAADPLIRAKRRLGQISR